MRTLSQSFVSAAVLSSLVCGSITPAWAQQAKPAAAPTAKPAAAPAAPKPAAAPAAAPATKKVDPKALFASGEKKFKAGDYAGALADFDAAQTDKPNPALSRYQGLCRDNLGQPRDAVALYEKYLEVPAKGAAQEKEYAVVKERVAAIKQLPGKVRLQSTPPGAQVVVDDKPQEKPTPTELELAPGKHKLALSAEGREPAEREVEVAYAQTQELAVELAEKPVPPPPPPVAVEPPPPPPPPPPAPPPPEPRSMLPAYITGGVAIVGAGVGTYFGLRALSLQSDFKSTPTVDLADKGENAALIADMCFGVAITFGVTSAVLFLSDSQDAAKDAPKEGAPPAKAQPAAPAKSATNAARSGVRIIPTPIVTPTGGGAGALIRF